MKLARLKKFLFYFLILGTIICVPLLSYGTDYSSTSFKIKDSVIDVGQSSLSSTNFGLGQSLGQTAIGKSTSTNFQLWSGFQYFFKVKANTLTATAGNGQVSLSWAAPQTFLGVSVGDYELGTGTVSGSYTFEDVGNVTSYTKTGLTNSTTYYFKVKAKTAGGTFLVFSNEASATPIGTGITAGVVGSGGSGIPVPGATIEISGLASPAAAVTVLKDGSIIATTIADNEAVFNFTLKGLSAGVYNFGIYAVDREGTKSAGYNFSQNLQTGITVTKDNIFLAPSIRATHLVIKKGEKITFSGFTVPNADLSFFLDSELKEKIQAQADGSWRLTLSTGDLSAGKYGITVKATKNGRSSSSSTAIEFEVNEEKSILVSPEKSNRADFNSDSRVDLIDFSILLFYWQKPISGYIQADINKDGAVDLIDFSIMLYDWTG